MKQFRVTLEAARVNVGLSQKQAAPLVGVSLSTLKNYESGKTKPNWDTLSRMSNTYRIPIGMLKCT